MYGCITMLKNSSYKYSGSILCENDSVGRCTKNISEVRKSKNMFLPHTKKRDVEIGGHRRRSELMEAGFRIRIRIYLSPEILISILIRMKSFFLLLI